MGDGYCDDVNNNLECNYDGGDCCGSNVNVQYCTECQCLDVGGGGGEGTTTSSGTTNSGSCNLAWMEDGYCDEINNNSDCNYDGGDCCDCQWMAECWCLK